MTSNTRPGFGRRLWRALIQMLALLTFLLILGGIGVAGYVGSQEIQRSFNNVNRRIQANEQTTSLLRSDVNTLMQADPDQIQQLLALEATISALERQVDTMQTDLTADLAQKQSSLDTLVESVTSSADQAISLESNMIMLNEAINALQGDINENGGRIDLLGGEVDAVQTAITGVETDIQVMEEQQAARFETDQQTVTVREAVALFRVWELITRARLRLLENNAGLATADIEAAVQTLDILLAGETDLDLAKLEMIQARLALAFVSLPDNPTMAAADLENAWDELDAIFLNEILGGIEAGITETGQEGAPGEEDTTTQESSDSEIQATATPEPTATPSP